ncbi:MAG: hypothetical protein Q8N73_02895 [bacterium]|nr:hypothetical protein [bacterium]
MAWLPALIASAIAQVLFYIPVVASIALFGSAERLLRFVLSPDFINVPYTTNDFVTLGWTLTRDFANIFFIIVLVIIGLATALRIREYQWQKALPLLIGIALLINFTPVILGLIIDASNIIMNFFVSGIAKEGFFVPRIQIYHQSVLKLISEANFRDPGSYYATLITPIFYIIFNLIAAIIYFLFAILFVLRYVALWTLVILSPIAFLCYILPATREIFSLWRNQFIQWCIIGIAAAFFLYLGDNLLYFVMEGGFVAGGNQEGYGIINDLIPYCVVLGFLLIGFFGALSSSAMGAKVVISAAQKGVTATTSKAAKWTGKKAERGIEKGLKIPERAERLGRWAAGKPIFGAAASPLIGYAKRRREEGKKEFEGSPFATRAKMTRKKGQSVQDSLRDIVRGLDPRKFASEAQPDDITLDVLRAMSMKQATVTGERGSNKLKESLQNVIKNNGVALQTEYNNLLATDPVKANLLYQKILHIQNPNYIT